MEFALPTPQRDCCGQSSRLQVAVESLDMAMFEGQILALLGHNGAGKSTTINMHPVQKYCFRKRSSVPFCTQGNDACFYSILIYKT